MCLASALTLCFFMNPCSERPVVVTIGQVTNTDKTRRPAMRSHEEPGDEPSSTLMMTEHLGKHR
jgi:hypothetical protein